MGDIAVGDVVYVEGASAIQGDVIDVAEEGVAVRWRETETTEDADELLRVVDPAARPSVRSAEVGSIYVGDGERFVVSLIVSYSDELVKAPKEAAAAALDLTRDLGSPDTVWFVFDRQTRQMHELEQHEFEGMRVR